MENWLRRFARLTPGELIATFWAVDVALVALSFVKPLSGLAAVVVFLFWCGYPYAVILGMPEGIVRRSIRAWCRPAFVVLLVAAVLLAIALPTGSEDGYATSMAPITLRGWFEMIHRLALIVGMFSPFFAGAMALNDIRGGRPEDPALRTVFHFFALYFWPFGGALFVHRIVREALHDA